MKAPLLLLRVVTPSSGGTFTDDCHAAEGKDEFTCETTVFLFKSSDYKYKANMFVKQLYSKSILQIQNTNKGDIGDAMRREFC